MKTLAPILWFLILPLLAAAAVSGPNQPPPYRLEVAPSKIELRLNQGERREQTVTVKNFSREELVVETTVENFAAGPNAEDPLTLLGAAPSATGLKEHLILAPADLSFRLAPGASREINFSVTLASSTSGLPDQTVVRAGARYGALTFTAKPLAASSTAGVGVSLRLGVLIFVRVAGPAWEQGELKEFEVNKNAAGRPESFDVLFENQGDVYLNPYGFISAKNWRGRETLFLPIEPWFVMPHSLRRQSLAVPEPLGPGWYRLTLKLNRGYGNLVDERTQTVFVWSWLYGAAAALAAAALWWLLHRFWLWRKK